MKFNIWALLFIFLVVYFLFQIRDDLLRRQELVSSKAKLFSRLKEEELKQSTYRRALTDLSSDRKLEALARERLNLIKKGEIAFKVCQ
ncbi:septum formation initiator family protein [Candidatus Saganbacteria bacterium]|nr:septum formation initiator family protein [Candidatus Saganbacteria bacterium]